MKRFVTILFFWCVCIGIGRASNVRIVEQAEIDVYGIKSNIAEITMKIEWDNSWRDESNWDAVYVFLKCKKETDLEWSHLWLRDGFHTIEEDGYTYWMASNPDGIADQCPGIFIYRNKTGKGKSSVTLNLKWLITKNGYTKQQMINGIEYEAAVVEMVYIPKGPFVPGDQFSKQSFQKNYRQILPEDDLISPATNLMSDMNYNSYDTQFDPTGDYSPKNVCDRINDTHVSDYAHLWHSDVKGTSSITFAFDSKKTVRYVAVEGYKYTPTTWSIKGGTKVGTKYKWDVLGTFTSVDWPINSGMAYPASHAVKLDKPGAYQYYMLEMVSSSWMCVRTVSMTEKDLDKVTDDAYVIEGRGNAIAFNNTQGLSLKELDLSGSLYEYSPVGYEGFYVMKYEISQAQYTGFLNKLLYDQQKLRTIGDDLDKLEVGDYVYGKRTNPSDLKTKPVCRNGIVVGAKQDVRYYFTSNLNPSDDLNSGSDGQNIACNFLSPADMLAYASWCGLRPLSELEYEKMARQGYNPTTGKMTAPVQGGFAWETSVATAPGGESFSAVGTASEKLNSGNVNVGDVISGPVRTGSFASGATSRTASGGSYYGVMELSGNLAEIYYNSVPAKKLLSGQLIAHGNGSLLSDGNMHSRLNGYWGNLTTATLPSYFIPRGGSFRSPIERARISDRGCEGYFNSVNQKDSTMTFRLGHSVTYYQSTADPDYYPSSYLKAENGLTTVNGTVADSICTGVSYTIYGSELLTSNGSSSTATLTGKVQYIWYSKTEEGPWKIMRGKNGKDLTLEPDELQNNSSLIRILSFTRDAYTPTQYSGSGILNLRLEANHPFSHDSEETLQANNHISGILVESRPAATFKWSCQYGGKMKELASNYDVATSSYLSITRDSFAGSGEGTIYCDVTTNANKCKKRLSFPLTVKARPTSGIATNAMTSGNCGQFVKDARDGEVYGTVKINNQCWMAENMRYKGDDIPKNYIAYSPLDPAGHVYGVEYYSHSSIHDLICPEGWRMPTYNDVNALKVFADQGDGLGGLRLKAGNYWRVSNANQSEYFNYIKGKMWADTDNPTGFGGDYQSIGFGLMGGGYNGAYPREEAWLMAWYSSTWQYIWRLYYSDGNLFYWTTSSYNMPVRCILKTTSVD